MSTLVPDRYRAVSVADLAGGLTQTELRDELVGRPAYRRTVYVVARSAGRTAVARVQRERDGPLFSPISRLEVLAGPHETTYLIRPDVDVAVPSQLAAAAARDAPGARCAVVEGRYQHVSFILEPAPLVVHVLDVVPPHPPKLVDQVRRVLDLRDDLPPVRLSPIVVDLAELAGRLVLPGRGPSGGQRPHLLVPCRGGGVEVAGAELSYLDQVPAEADWTLLGCARSQAIHEFFYRRTAPAIDTCPRELADDHPVGPDDIVLTKCCLRETGVGWEQGRVVVPWGASFAEIGAGLDLAVRTVAQRRDEREAGRPAATQEDGA